jgi:hypothetical protein
MTDDEKIANRIANDIVHRANAFVDRNQPVGPTIVVARDAARAAELHAAVSARWKTMLSAYSSGIAHAEQDVDTGPAETTLAQLRKLEVVPLDGAPSPNATSSIVVVVDPSRVPTRVVVAYVTIPLDDAWRTALANMGAATVDGSAAGGTSQTRTVDVTVDGRR